MSKTLWKLTLLFLPIVLFSSCEKNGTDGHDLLEEELEAMEKITVGAPYFTVNPGTTGNIFRVAWTGKKLWAITDVGSGDIPQKLLEIDTADGSIVQSIAYNDPGNSTQIFSLDYANSKLWDINTFSLPEDPKFAYTYSAETGEATATWNYSGQYQWYYYLTFDGTHYWSGANYNFEESNCQAIVSYDINGNVIKAYEMCGDKYAADKGFPYGNDCEDMVYGGGYLWASRKMGDYKIISKLDTMLNVIESYKITDGDKFGMVQYSNEIAMHLEYIDGNLWIVDRFNNFYKTILQ